MIYAVGTYGYLYAFDAATGMMQWQVPLGTSYSSPTIDDQGYIYVGTFQGNFLKVSPIGIVMYNILLGGSVNGSAAFDRLGNAYVGTITGDLYALGPNGSQRWSANVGAAIKGAPVISDHNYVHGGLGRSQKNCCTLGPKMGRCIAIQLMRVAIETNWCQAMVF